MKRLLYIVATAALAGVLCIGVALTYMHVVGRTLDEESRAFVNETMRAIFVDWKEEELIIRASPELLQSGTRRELSNMFQTLSRLGAVQEQGVATGEAAIGVFWGAANVVTAAYSVRTKFAHGTAIFRIALVKREGRWLIHNFQVEPKLDNAPKKI